MNYRSKLILKAIAALIIIAAITIAVHIYWFEHSIMQRWGSTLVIMNMLLNMTVVVIVLITMNRHNQANKR